MPILRFFRNRFVGRAIAGLCILLMPALLIIFAPLTGFPYLRNKFLNWILVGVLVGTGFIFLGLVMIVFGLVFGADVFGGLAFFQLSLAMPHAILGLLVIAITLTVFCLHTLRNRKTASRQAKGITLIFGLPMAAGLLFLMYIPSGPDQCSRSFTDTMYENCLLGLFQDKTVAEASIWLTDNGYSVSDNKGALEKYKKLSEKDFQKKFGRYGSKKGEYHLWAHRKHGFGKSIPYGTNFNRIFGRLPPAPSMFELDLKALDNSDRVFSIKAHWSFSFL